MGNLGYRKRSLAPTERPSACDLAWAAGIFEGEGSSIRLTRRHNPGKYSTEMATLGQKGRWLVNRMRALFGGNVGIRERKKSIYYWAVTGARARGFLMTIYGLMSPRRQAQIRRTLQWEEYA